MAQYHTSPIAVWLLCVAVCAGLGPCGIDLINYDAFGVSSTLLGDLNGDGVVDLVVGGYDGTSDYGAVWILFLDTGGLVKGYQKIDREEGGFAGPLGEDRFGTSVASLGDLDGDGVIDLAVGANWDSDDGSGKGAVWILFLNRDGTVKAQQKINTLEGGFTGTLSRNDYFGSSLANIGDLDGDGVVDLAVGAPWDDDLGDRSGSIWILFLHANGTVKSHQKISATAGDFTGSLSSYDAFGASIANLGDLDGDGVTDIVVGAYSDDDEVNRGAVWILFLHTNGTVKSHQKISATQGGFTGNLFADDYFGWSVASLGDLDQDGVTDLAIGAVEDDTGGTDSGAVWIVFLHSDGTVKSNRKIEAYEAGYTSIVYDSMRFGSSLTGLGDLDGDGVMDLAVGVARDDSGGESRGAVITLFLQTNGYVKTLQRIDALQGAPLVQTVVPDYGPIQGGPTTTISGVCLGSGTDITAVTLCGVVASIDSQEEDSVTVNMEDASSVCPSGCVGDVVVTSTSMLVTTLKNGFAYRVSNISSVSPAEGPVQGGTSVTISGEHLGSGDDITSVTICGIPVQSISDQTHDSVVEVVTGDATATYPLGTKGDIVITSTSMLTTTLDDGFTYLLSTINLVDPVQGPLRGGTQVAIFGNNLGCGNDITAVSFCGVFVQSIISQTRDWVLVSTGIATGAHPSGCVGDVVITSTSMLETTLVNGFTYELGSITSVQPSQGSINGGASITITGKDLGDGSDIHSVALCGISVASIVSQTEDSVIVQTGGAIGTYPLGIVGAVVVGSTSMLSASLEDGFTYVVNVIHSLEPTRGSIEGGTRLTITGENLGNGNDITSVTLCGTPVASIDSQTMNTVVVITGTTSTVGTCNVVITSTSYGTTTSSLRVTFTYEDTGGESGDSLILGLTVTDFLIRLIVFVFCAISVLILGLSWNRIRIRLWTHSRCWVTRIPNSEEAERVIMRRGWVPTRWERLMLWIWEPKDHRKTRDVSAALPAENIAEAVRIMAVEMTPVSSTSNLVTQPSKDFM